MMSPSWSFCCSAKCGLTHAVGSHVILVRGFGSSCSQPLCVKRPSQIVGWGGKMISRPPVEAGGWGLEVGGWRLKVGVGATPAAVATAADEAKPPASSLRPPASDDAVPGIHPSCSTWFQKLAELLNGCPVGSVIAAPPTLPATPHTQKHSPTAWADFPFEPCSKPSSPPAAVPPPSCGTLRACVV